MASTAPPHATETPPAEAMKSWTPPPELPENKATSSGGGVTITRNHAVVDVVLRVLLFATALVAVVLMATSKQTELIPVSPFLAVPVESKFNHSPALVYFIAALSVACLYSIITAFLSMFAFVKPGGTLTKLQFHFVILDSLFLGIVAAATGASGGVAYIGLKGNSHAGWNKICNVYDSYCRHVGASISLSLASSIVLLLLVWFSVYVLSKKISTS